MRYVMCILAFFWLSACDTGSAPETSSSGTQPLDPASFSDPALLAEGTFAVSITGSVNAEIGRIVTTVTRVPNDNFSQHALDLGSPEAGYYVRIGFSGSPAAGTYNLLTAGTEVTQEGAFSASVVSALSPEPSQQYRTNPQGTIAFAPDGTTISGNFTLSVQSDIGGQTVTVQGAFNRVPFDFSS